MPISTPACTHPPLPKHTVGVRSYDFGRMHRPYATVLAQVDPHGVVTSATIEDSSGDAGYDAAALDAMKRWQFVPAAAECNAIPGTAEYVVGPYDTTDFADPCNHEGNTTHETTPAYPPIARFSGMDRVSAFVFVTLDPAGRLMTVTIAQSTGNMAMDDAAVAASKQSTYLPKVVRCMPVTARYIFAVTFDIHE